MRTSVLGAGYLGVTHAACMAELGHDVVAVDVDAAKIEMLRDGTVPFYEPHLEPLVHRGLSSGRLTFTTSYDDVAAGADVHFLCVGTPQRKGEYAADLDHVNAAVSALARRLRGSATIVGKSTVPVGTADRLTELVRRLAPENVDVRIAWNPEFLREGFAVEDTLQPDRIVLGVARDDDGSAESTLRDLYAVPLSTGTPLLVTDLATAELVKASANAFLATKISFINAIADVCEAAGADVTMLAEALGHDPRIGRRFLNAGVGFGGGCLPKDIRAFRARAAELGIELTLLREVDEINIRRRERVVVMAKHLLDGRLLGSRITVLGCAFKPDSDDVRDSPALNIAGQLHLGGASVTVYDPKAMDNSRALSPTLTYAESASEAARGADLVLLLTEWDEFKALDPHELGSVVRGRRLVDGRNCLDPDAWRAAGWSYRGIGVPASP